MGKLRQLSGADVCKILEEEGFTRARQKGSHVMMQIVLEDTTVTVPVPSHTRELPVGTLASIIRQSKLPRDKFEA